MVTLPGSGCPDQIMFNEVNIFAKTQIMELLDTPQHVTSDFHLLHVDKILQ